MGQFVPDLIARVTLAEGDASARPAPRGRLGCTLVFAGQGHACKLGFDGALQPGREHEVALAFLEVEKPVLRVGDRFELRHPPGAGIVVRLLP